MTSDSEIEIHRALRDSQNKYKYFLLAVVGAAVALVVNQTQGASLIWYQVPLAAAVLAWALSFLCGCLNLSYVNAGRNNLLGTNSVAIQIAREELYRIFDDQSKKANRYAHCQFRLLVTGAVFYMGWHIMGIYLRTK